MLSIISTACDSTESDTVSYGESDEEDFVIEEEAKLDLEGDELKRKPARHHNHNRDGLYYFIPTRELIHFIHHFFIAPKETYTKQSMKTFFGDDVRTPGSLPLLHHFLFLSPPINPSVTDKGNKPQEKGERGNKIDPSFRDDRLLSQLVGL